MNETRLANYEKKKKFTEKQKHASCYGATRYMNLMSQTRATFLST